MTAIANVVLNDAEATPVARTFKPGKQGIVGQDQLVEYEDRDANSGVPVGFGKLELVFSRPIKVRKTYHIGLKLSTPVMENITNSTVTGIEPAPTVAYVPLFQGKFVIPERATAQVRKNLRKLTYEMFNHAQIKSAVEDLDPPL